MDWIQVAIAPDEMEARVTVSPEAGAVDPAEIEAALRSHGVVWGVNREALALAAANPGTPVPAARGTPPQPGENGRLEILFPRDPGPRPVSDRERIDYRERPAVPAVEPGQVIARVIPPGPGVPGMTVTGREVPAPAGRPARLAAGAGTSWGDDGTSLRADRLGQPVMDAAGESVVIHVIPTLNHRGDVDMATGNLRFSGNIVVQGDVAKGMTVEAGGSVLVLGDVSGATVSAGRQIKVCGRVIGSRLTAGTVVAIKPWAADLAALAAGIRSLLASAQELARRASPAFRANMERLIGPTIQTLLETKHKDLHALLQRLQAQAAAMAENLPAEVLDTVERSWAALGRRSALRIREAGLLAELAALAEARAHELAEGAARLGSVEAPYLHNSTVHAAGHVHILGQGCFLSLVRSGGNIVVRGAARGATLEAAGNVRVGSAGSPRGRDQGCQVVVGEKGWAEFTRVYPGVSVRVGNASYRFQEELTHLRVRLGPRDEPALEPA